MEKTNQSDWLEKWHRLLGCIKLPALSNLIWFLLSRISKPTWIKLVELQMNLSTFIMRQWIKEEGYVDILTTVRTVFCIFCLFFFFLTCITLERNECWLPCVVLARLRPLFLLLRVLYVTVQHCCKRGPFRKCLRLHYNSSVHVSLHYRHRIWSVQTDNICFICLSGQDLADFFPNFFY